MSVTNFVLNIALIPTVGIAGAAIATVLSFFVRDILAVVQVQQQLGAIPITWEVIRSALVAVPLLVVFVTVVYPVVPTGILWIIVTTGLFAIVYIGVVLIAFGLSGTEVMLIRSAEESYGINLGPIDPIIHYLSKR
jgi:peptidoglycan biosynthesis protein MviN/MurJ (putative lipid II flippase)